MIRIPVNSRLLKLLLCAAMVINIALAVYLFSGPGQGYGCGIEGNVMKNAGPSGGADAPSICPGVVLNIRDAATNKFITKITTDENGYFRVHLVPGRYLVEVASEGGGTFLYGTAPEQEVEGGELTRLTVYVSATPYENRALPWMRDGIA